MQKEKCEVWEEFALTLNYSMEPIKVMKICKSIKKDIPTNPINITIELSNNSKIISDKDKAKLFCKMHTEISKKLLIPKNKRKINYRNSILNH